VAVCWTTVFGEGLDRIAGVDAWHT